MSWASRAVVLLTLSLCCASVAAAAVLAGDAYDDKDNLLQVEGFGNEEVKESHMREYRVDVYTLRFLGSVVFLIFFFVRTLRYDEQLFFVNDVVRLWARLTRLVYSRTEQNNTNRTPRPGQETPFSIIQRVYLYSVAPNLYSNRGGRLMCE